MKKIFFVISILLLNSCVFTYDPASGLLNIDNKSDKAVYVYLKCGNVDSLPLYPKLELFQLVSAKMEDAKGNTIKPYYISPEYRINAYTVGSLSVWGTRKKPSLPCKENKVTLFFITEKTMQDFSWEEIYRNQMFENKITLTNKELENEDWKYTYSVKSKNVKPN